MCRSSLITMLKLLHATTKMIAVTSGKEGGRKGGRGGGRVRVKRGREGGRKGGREGGREGGEQSEGGRDRNDGWQKG